MLARLIGVRLNQIERNGNEAVLVLADGVDRMVLARRLVEDVLSQAREVSPILWRHGG